MSMICVAHRGASGEYPENTLLAFRKALAAGALWLELDVRLTADGALVVIHDETLERTTDGSGRVSDLPLAELRGLNAGCGESVPLLTEVLGLLGEEHTLNIELKGDGTGAATARLLREWLGRGRIRPANLLVSSFSAQALDPCLQLVPQVRRALIRDQPEDPPDFWEAVSELQPWSLHLARTLVPSALQREARRRGLRILVFTVNQQAELQRLSGFGIDGIFTDFPGLLDPRMTSGEEGDP